MEVHSFKKTEVKKALKNTPKLIQQYVKALENVNEISKNTIAKATAKIKELSRQKG